MTDERAKESEKPTNCERPWYFAWKQKQTEQSQLPKLAKVQSTVLFIMKTLKKREIETPSVPDSSIDQFLTLVKAGVDSWTKAGKVLVELIDKDQTVFERILRKAPNFTVQELHHFELLGRGLIKPWTMLLPEQQRKAVSKLPPKIQESLEKSCVPVVKPTKTGGFNVKPKKIQELTAQELKQVFDDGHIATRKQQEQHIQRLQARAVAPRYKIEGDCVVFYARTKLNAAQLEQILAILKKRASQSLEADMKTGQVRR